MHPTEAVVMLDFHMMYYCTTVNYHGNDIITASIENLKFKQNIRKRCGCNVAYVHKH